MNYKIKDEILYIYKKIHDAGFEVYFVGGCVRDLIMKREVKDWDLTTNATPEQIQSIFPNSFYDNKFGTVGIPFEEKLEDEKNLETKNYLEITTFRKERGYKDLRRPEFVEWGKSLEEDLSRRDFTINAIALRSPASHGKPFVGLPQNKPSIRPSQGKQSQFEIIDIYGGQEDIKNKIIRAVGNPYERFKEDALRLMRAIRLASQLNFKVEEETWNAIIANARLIAYVSNERIRDEFLKILESDNHYEGIILLDKSGILDLILPEITKGKGVSQERPGRHHKEDVFTHSLLSLKYSPSKDPIVRLATLIHDTGKPFTLEFDQENLVTFYNHEIVGAKLAKEIGYRLRLSKKQIDKIYILVRWHMFTVDEKITDSAIRRFIRRVGLENVKDIIDLRIGDRLGSNVPAESWRLRRFKERILKELNPPFSLNDLAVNGHDVMKELNIKPGPVVGKILNKLFEEVDEDLSKNNKEYLLKRIREIGKEMNNES